MAETAKYQGRAEELPFIAVYLLVSLKRDKALFKAFAKAFTDEYITSFETQKSVVDLLINPFHLTGERKVITVLVSADYTKIRNMLNMIEVFLRMTEAPLTIAASDFGIKMVRKELKSKNDEGIVMWLKVVFKNVEDNKVALEPAGYTPEVSAEFSQLIDSLSTDSVDQNLKLDSRIDLTQANIVEMNKLWKFMDNVMDAGKKIAFARKNTLMHKDYTFTELEKKVRLERGEEPPTPPPAPQP